MNDDQVVSDHSGSLCQCRDVSVSVLSGAVRLLCQMGYG